MRKYVLLLLLLPALLLAAACTPDPADGSLPADTSSDAVSAPEKPYQTAQVYIDCPTDITKDAYVQAAVRIVDPNGRFAEIDDGEATVKVRGNSTSSGAKKPYNIKLSSKKDVLGMGRAKKWCLLANLYDKTMLRNKLSYDFAAEIGMDYVSSCEFAELYLNGVYRGCYLLTEAVEIGEIPQEYNPVASYIKTFFVPTQMVGKRVFISFQGAESCIAVWLNGRYVGFSSDSFTPSEFELTDYLVEGENKLACRVERWSAGSWLEDQDFMRFSGIFRDVYLYAIPKAHIADIRVKTLLDDSFTDATLDLAMKMELDAAVGACRVKMALLDGGEVIAAAERVAEGEIAVQLPVKAPRLWSSEAPNLYDLLLTAEDGKFEPDGRTPKWRVIQVWNQAFPKE